MPYPVLNINPSLVFPRNTSFNVLDSGQGNGRSLRRVVDPRELKGYDLTFDKVTCSNKDSILSIIFTPFQLNTPDDGVVNVVIIADSITISSDSPSTFSISFSVEQVLFTN